MNIVTQKIKSIINISLLNFNILLRNYKNLWYFGIFFFVAIITPIVFMPYNFSGGEEIVFYLTTPLFIVLGWLTYNFRLSSLYGNLSISGITKNEFYLSSIFTIFIIGNILTITFVPVVFILGKLGGIFMSEWGFLGGKTFPSGINLFEYSSLVNLIYISNLDIIVVFSVYFLVHNLFLNIKTYYSFVFAIIILNIVLGGVLNTYFDDAYNIEGRYIPYKVNLFPDSYFIISLFFPFYGIGQQFSFGVNLTGINYYGIGNMGHFFTINWNNNGWQWSIVLIQPYIWILFSFVSGLIINKFKKTS